MAEKLYRIGDAAGLLGLKTSVLRYWETEFSQLRPVRIGKGQRRYTEADMALLTRIRYLVHDQGLTIEGARKVLRGASALSLAVEPEMPVPVRTLAQTDSTGVRAGTGPVLDGKPHDTKARPLDRGKENPVADREPPSSTLPAPILTEEAAGDPEAGEPSTGRCGKNPEILMQLSFDFAAPLSRSSTRPAEETQDAAARPASADDAQVRLRRVTRELRDLQALLRGV